MMPISLNLWYLSARRPPTIGEIVLVKCSVIRMMPTSLFALTGSSDGRIIETAWSRSEPTIVIDITYERLWNVHELWIIIYDLLAFDSAANLWSFPDTKIIFVHHYLYKRSNKNFQFVNRWSRFWWWLQPSLSQSLSLIGDIYRIRIVDKVKCDKCHQWYYCCDRIDCQYLTFDWFVKQIFFFK